jgi:hypothetical protein
MRTFEIQMKNTEKLERGCMRVQVVNSRYVGRIGVFMLGLCLYSIVYCTVYTVQVTPQLSNKWIGEEGEGVTVLFSFHHRVFIQPPAKLSKSCPIPLQLAGGFSLR